MQALQLGALASECDMLRVMVHASDFCRLSENYTQTSFNLRRILLLLHTLVLLVSWVIGHYIDVKELATALPDPIDLDQRIHCTDPQPSETSREQFPH